MTTTTTEKVTTTSAPATTTSTNVTTSTGTETTPAQTTTTGESPQPEFKQGDVNGDGEIGVEDAQRTLKAYTNGIAGKGNGLSDAEKKAADVNGNGEVSVDDAQNILKYYTEKSVAGKDITWEDIIGKKVQSLPQLLQRVLRF